MQFDAFSDSYNLIDLLQSLRDRLNNSKVLSHQYACSLLNVLNISHQICPLVILSVLKRNLQTSASIEKSGKCSKTRPHKCKKCDAEFNKESHLKDHNAAIHEEKRPHRCKMCSLAFSFSTDLINHVSVVHDRKKPKPYIVNVGEKRGGCY